MGTRGWRGASVLTALLRERFEPRDSALEVLVDKFWLAAEVPAPRRQHVIVEDGEYIVKADFAWPGVKMAVLAQGYRFHSARQPFENDSVQKSELTSRGWLVLTPTWRSIHASPNRFINQVQRTYARALDIARTASPPDVRVCRSDGPRQP